MRRVRVVRETRETRVAVDVALEPGSVKASTGIGFLDHLLETLLYYAGLSGTVEAVDKRGFDDHHVAEDTALALGEALRRLVEGTTISRYGYAVVPMDECLVLAAVDVSGRPYFSVELPFTRSEVGGLATENIVHFIRSLAYSLAATVHVRALAWGNNHHLAEAAFKALGLALSQALTPSSRGWSLKGRVRLEVERYGG